MSDPAKTIDQNILPVQALFNLDNSFNTFIGQGQPFYATTNPSQTGLNITNSTINSTTIGATTPSTGVFTNILTTTGQITTTPTASLDIANKAYVDATSQGLSFKQPVLVTTTGNITLSGTQTIDGIAVSVGDRVLVKNQTTQSQNGIYIVASGAWSRSPDANTWDELLAAYLFVLEGTTWAGSSWVDTNVPGGTLGVTSVTFVQFSNNATYTAGTGLTLTGFQFSITPVGTAGTYGSASNVPVLTTNASGQVSSVTNTPIAIGASQVTSGTFASSLLSGSYTGITGVGTLTAGTWNGSTIGVAYGGTGANTFTAGYLKASGTSPFSTVSSIPSSDITGLGTMSTQNANAVNITGGTIALTTPLAVSSGGSGATTLTGYLIGNGTGAFTASTTIPTTALSGTISNAQLANSSITINGSSISLGGSATITANTTNALTIGTGLSGTSFNGSAAVTIANTGVLSFSAGTTGFTPSTTTTGAVTLGGLLALSNGGTNANLTAVAGGIAYSGASALAISAAGTTGQFLQSNGAGAPTWATPVSYATVTDDTTTAGTRYPLFANQTSGSLATEYTSSTKLQYNPSTGVFTATGFSGSGASLTSLTAGNLSGTIPSAVLGNSSLYIGTTAVPLNAASGSITSLAVNISGSASSATTATTATNANNVAVTDNTSSIATWYPTLLSTTTGNLPITTSSTKMTFVPSTGLLTTTAHALSTSALTSSNTSNLAMGGNLGFSDTGILANFVTTLNSYAQYALQNKSNGTAASTEFIAYNDAGTASTNFATFGINSSGYTGTGAINAAGYSYFLSGSTDIVIGTIGANSIHLTTNSQATDAVTINTSNAVAFNGAYGTAGQVLTSQGSGSAPTWTSGSGLTITDDTSTNATRYLTFTSATSGTITSENVSSTKLQYNPSTGTLKSVGQFSSDSTFGFKNRIINGAMGIWQRGTSQSTSGYGSVDRFQFDNAGTYTQSTDVPAGFKYSCGVSVTSATTYGVIKQNIESLNCIDLSGQTVTLSFWYKNLTGSTTMTANLYYANASDNFAGGTTLIQSQQFTGVLNTWTKYSLTYTNLPAGVLNGLQVYIYSADASVAPSYRITGVQLEKGTTATSFDYRPYGTELALCQRYGLKVEQQQNTGDVVSTGGNVNTKFTFPVTMRATPTASLITAGSWIVGNGYSANYTSSSAAIGGQALTPSGGRVNVNGFTFASNFFASGTDAAGTAVMFMSAEL